MKVSEFREALAKFPDDAIVVVAKDAEGNAFAPLDEMSLGAYERTGAWSGDFTCINEDDDFEDFFITREEYNELVAEHPAVCLWPVN